VPVRGDGTIDEQERAIVEGIADWMDDNSESIFGTRPWKVCGEGPQLDAAPAANAHAFNEGKGPPLTNKDIRYTQKDGVLYAFVMAKPTGDVTFAALAPDRKLLAGEVTRVEQLGVGRVRWTLGDAGLVVLPDVERVAHNDEVLVFRIVTDAPAGR
jgi:alpha-L-fucosidase